MSKMNPEIKARWVAALRSGEYKQGNAFLKRGDSFCCLGVLCDLHAKEVGGAWNHFHIGCDSYNGLSMGCPEVIAEWAQHKEIFGPGPDLVIDGKRATAAHHNDKGRTFAEIADAIEEQL